MRAGHPTGWDHYRRSSGGPALYDNGGERRCHKFYTHCFTEWEAVSRRGVCGLGGRCGTAGGHSGQAAETERRLYLRSTALCVCPHGYADVSER